MTNRPPAPPEARAPAIPATPAGPCTPAACAGPATRRRALRVLASYAVFGTAWILLSDRLLLAVAPDMASLSALGLWKGLAFILLSTLLLYLLMVRATPVDDAAPREPEGDAEARTAGIASACLWGAFALAALAIVGVGLFGVGSAASELRDGELQDLRAFTESQVKAVSAWRGDRLGDAEAQGNDTVLEAAMREWRRTGAPRARDAVVAQLRAISLMTDYEDAAFVDASGNVLASGGDKPFMASARIGALVRQALVTGRAVESGFEPVGEGRSMRFDVVAPFRGATPHDSFALVLCADPSRSLLSALGRTRRETPTRVLLATRAAGGAGFRLVATPDGGADDPLARRVLPWLAARGAGTSPVDGSLPGSAADTSRELTVAMPVPDTPWVVVAWADEAALVAATSRRSAWIAIADVLVIGAAAVLLFTAWQRRELRVARRDRRQQAERLQALKLLDAIANASTDAIYAKDTQGRYLFVNDALCRLIGQPRAAALGRRSDEITAPAEARRLWQAQEAAMRGGAVRQSEGWADTPTGRRYFLSVMGPLTGPAGELIGMFEIARDTSARRLEEDRMRQWAAAMAASREGVLITDRQGRIVAVNRAFSTITGWTEEEALGETPAILRSGRHDGAFYRTMWETLQSEGHWQGEIWNRRKCGEVYPEWLTVSEVRDDRDEVTHYVGVFSDVSGLKRNEAQLERLAHYDALTELPNRRLLQQRVDQALAHARRLGSRVAVLTLDIDHFKNVNDSWDHAAGDELLVALAHRLRARLRAEDTLGRLGGDEFLVLVDDLTDASAGGGVASLADDLLDAVSMPVQLSGGREVRVTASLGIALFPDDGADDAAQMLRNADAAMYRAKEGGRNQFSFYTADLNDLAVRRLEMETALARAIERGELQLHYQPKVDATTGRIVAAEALLRWFRPDGLVSPAQFMPVVESGPLIFEIGGWVIDRACAQLREWLDAGAPVVPIAVNVAARQFAAGDLDLVVARALQKHDVPPDLLEIELTETALLEHGNETTLLLHRLKAQGVQLSLDDFGTGYSSLAYLRQFPIDEVKIDRAFVRDIGVGDDGAAIVDMVLALGRRLRLRVVAEGVETEAQRAYLAHHGCHLLQGFLFAKPGPAAALQAMLAAPQSQPLAATNVYALRAS